MITSNASHRIVAKAGALACAVLLAATAAHATRSPNVERFTFGWDPARDVKPGAGAHEGERVLYSYDTAGRLLTRTHLGPIPAGKTDADRPFIAKRAFIWDGERLAAEVGLNFSDQPIWRQHYLPGAGGLDDAPQVRIESGLQGATPTEKLYALLRDEMGTVLAVAEDAQAPGAQPRLLARYLHAPYGEAHVELGPELVEIVFDATMTKVGSQQQTITPNQTVGGALRLVTTLPLAPSSLDNGLPIERWNAGSGVWEAVTRAEFAIGTSDTDRATLLLMRLAGWPKGERYRITTRPSLADGFGRTLQLPSKESQGVEVILDIPADGVTAPQYAQQFEITRDSEAAANTLGGAFPGGQTSGFQGLWTDPLGGLLYARNRWLDPTNASWLSGDPLGPVDSQNLYSFVAAQPYMATDPLGLKARIERSKSKVAPTYTTCIVATPQGDMSRPCVDIPGGTVTVAGFAGAEDIPEYFASLHQIGMSDVEAAAMAARADPAAAPLKGTYLGAVTEGAVKANVVVEPAFNATMAFVSTVGVSTLAPGGAFAAIGSGTRTAEEAVAFGERALTNPLPTNGVFARVMPRRYAEAFARGEGTLSANPEAFITAQSDLADISTVAGAQERLSLFSDHAATTPNLSGDTVVSFRLRDQLAVGLRSPIETQPPRGFGFVGRDRTGGGAREWLVDSGTAEELGAFDIQLRPLVRR